MLLAEFDAEGGSSFHPMDATEMGGLSKYDGLDVSSIPTTRGDVVNGGIQVGFGDATDPIESVSNSSFASNYDSSEGYSPYIEAKSNSGDVISSDTDTFWKGTFAGEVLDLSDYTDKTTGADYSFSSDHIEIGIDGDYFTVTDQSKPDAPVYQPTADDLAGLVYTDERWHTEAVISPDATDPSKVDSAYSDVQVYFQYQDDDSKRYAIDYDGDGVPEMDINYDPDSAPTRIEDIEAADGSQPYPFMWTKHDNIDGADGVIGAPEGWEYDVWHLEDTSGKLTFAIRTDSSDPSTQVEIFDVNGDEFSLTGGGTLGTYDHDDDIGGNYNVGYSYYEHELPNLTPGQTVKVSTIDFGLSSSMHDTYLVLVDSQGNTLQSTDDSGYTRDGNEYGMETDDDNGYYSTISFTPAAGETYSVRVGDLGNDAFEPDNDDYGKTEYGLVLDRSEEGLPDFDLIKMSDLPTDWDASPSDLGVGGREASGNALPHATEDLYDADGNQLTPTVWENHSEVDGVQVYQTSDSLGQEMLAIDNADGEKTQVFNPEGTALVIADTIARKEDIFVDDGGQTQYYPFEYQDVTALGDGFDGVDSLEYREMVSKLIRITL